jgi:hypothetical protein
VPTPLTIADAAVAVGADFRKYDADLARQESATSSRLGRLGSALKRDFGLVAGAGFGALSAAALKLGTDVDSAYDTIRVGTGKTGEALAGLEADFKAVSGRVPDDIAKVAQVIADLNTRTGQTGKGLQDLSTTILDFSRLTKSDVNTNVRNATRLFGDWSIATEDQAGTLDKVFRASQETGIGVETLMQKVVDFGSPMRLLGFSFEESIALLSKWEKEGVNTETALSGLKFGVKTLAGEGVKAADMGEALRAKIEGIKASADPVGESIKTFGLRAGPDLAAAILEGRFSVDDLMESITNGSDTIAAATEDTQDFNDQWSKFTNQVKVNVGGLFTAFAGLSTTMGPLLYAFPALGGAIGRFAQRAGGNVVRGLTRSLGGLSRMVTSSGFVRSLSTGLGSALGKVTSTPAVSGGLDKLGRFMGSKLGKGLSIAFAAVAIFEVIQTYNDIKAGLDEQSAKIGEDLGNQIKAGTTESLQQSKAALEQGVKELSDLWYNPFAGGQKDALQRQLDATNAELELRASQTPEALAAKLEAGKAQVDAAAAEMAGGIPGAVVDAAQAAWESAGEIPRSVADGIRSRRNAAEQAMVDLIDGLKHAMSPAKERARLIGYLTSDELRKGLKSRDPAVRAQAEASRDLWLAQLAEMPVGANGLGKKAMNELNRAMKDKNPAVRAEARRVKKIIEDQIAAAKAREAGEKIDREVAAGIKTGTGPIGPAAWSVGRKIVTGMLAGISGPVALAKGGKAPAAFALGTMNVPADMFAMIHQGEIIVPEEASDEIRAGKASLGAPPAADPGRTGPLVGEMNIYNPVPEPASESVPRALTNLAFLGAA